MAEGKRFRYVIPAGSDSSRSLCFPFSYLKAILSHDRRMYGVAPGTVAVVPDDATAGGDEPLIQQRIEDLIETP
jgi:hypothetical protein